MRGTRVALRLLVVAAVAPIFVAGEDAFVDTEPPVISLQLNEVEISQYERTCQVLTDTSTTCPEPQAEAFDHHEGHLEVIKQVTVVEECLPKVRWVYLSVEP